VPSGKITTVQPLASNRAEVLASTRPLCCIGKVLNAIADALDRSQLLKK
jgi:hypothetical protein